MTTRFLPRDELQDLLEHRGDRCVSVYLPTHRVGDDIKQDPIRLKNLLAEAEKRLTDAGLRNTEAQELLERARALIDDEEFWQHQREGLALFLTPDDFRTYSLPLSFDPLVTVGEWFEVKPLLPLLALGDRFYILALSANQARLLEATRHSVIEIDVPGMPRSQAEALSHDDRESELQFHTGTGAEVVRGTRSAIFHGQGTGTDTHKLDLFRYFQRIDRALADFLADENAPLVLAAVDYEQPLYREANHYPHLLSKAIDGNPEQIAAEELRDRAWKLVEPSFREAEREAKARLGELRGTGRAAEDLEQVVQAAYWGQIDTLFVERGQHVWGHFDADANRVQVSDKDEPEPGDYDLLDLAARRTLAKGGTVFALKSERMPGKASAAAILRY